MKFNVHDAVSGKVKFSISYDQFKMLKCEACLKKSTTTKNKECFVYKEPNDETGVFTVGGRTELYFWDGDLIIPVL